MLQLTPLAGLFVASDRVAVREVSPKGLTTWSWGKKLVGVSRGRRLLTDGQADATFAGCQWAQAWDGREGYVVCDTSRLANYAFITPCVKAIFIGHPLLDCNYPPHVALPKDALPAGMCAPFPQRDSESFRAEKPLLLAAVAKGFPISFSLLDDYGCSSPRFRPLAPLSRQQWDSLGYHIYTNEGETLTNVVSYSREIDLSLPCSSVEEIASAFGLEGTPIHALEGYSRHLIFRSLTIIDPEKAKSVFPFVALMEPGNRIRRAVRDEKWHVRTSDWDALESIPGDLSIRWSDGDAVIVLFSIRDIEINGSRPLPIVQRDSSGEDMPHLVVTESLLETMLLSARKAAARYMIPETVKPYSVVLDGVVQGDRYYLLSDLSGVPPAPNKRAAFKSRRERLTAQFGEFLPENWQKLSDEGVVEHANWKRHRVNEGWMTSWDLSKSLDIANSTDLGSWLVSINWPSLPHPVSGEEQRLFAPITWDEVISHEAFADLFAAVIGTHQSFVQRTMFDEPARAKVFARMLAA